MRAGRSGGGARVAPDDLEAELSACGETVPLELTSKGPEVGGQVVGAGQDDGRGARRQMRAPRWPGAGGAHVLRDVERGARVAPQRGRQDEPDVAGRERGPLEVHGGERRFDLGHREGVRLEGRHGAGRRTIEPVQPDGEAGVALGEIVEEDLQFRRARRELGDDLDDSFLVAQVGGKEARFAPVHEEDGPAAGREAKAGGACRFGKEPGPCPGGNARRTEPEAREVEIPRLEAKVVRGVVGRAPHLGAAVAKDGGEGGPARIFVRDDIAVAGQEEGRIHLAGHGRVGQVEARLGDARDAPRTEGGSRKQRQERHVRRSGETEVAVNLRLRPPRRKPARDGLAMRG